MCVLFLAWLGLTLAVLIGTIVFRGFVYGME